jgi:hypothetical protein
VHPLLFLKEGEKSSCASNGLPRVMPLQLYHRQAFSRVSARLIPIPKRIESWPKLYGPEQSPRQIHCDPKRTIRMRHA